VPAASLLSAVRRRARGPVAAALDRVARRRATLVGLVLCYHRVGDPPGRTGHDLVPALGTRLFAAQVKALAARYRLVRASDVLAAAATRRRGERFPLAITFDDDLAVHVAHTAPALRALGATATFYLGGPALDGPRPFFWEALQAALDRGLDPADPLLPPVADPGGRGGRHRIADAIRRLERGERDALTAALVERAGGTPPEAGLRPDGVRALVAAGMEIGFHTRDHEALDLLGDDALAAALHDGRDRVAELAGAPLETVAYPFGAADARVAAATRAAGFSAAFTLAPEPVRPGSDDPFLLGRFQPSFASAAQTELELARATLAA